MKVLSQPCRRVAVDFKDLQVLYSYRKVLILHIFFRVHGTEGVFHSSVVLIFF